MRRAFLGLLVAALAGNLFGQSAAEVMEKHIRAIGGREKLSAVRSVEAWFTLKGMGEDLPVKVVWSSPNKLRMEISIQGNVIVQLFDGTRPSMYLTTPSTGFVEPMEMNDELKREMEKAAVDFNPVDVLGFDQDGTKLDVVGKELLKGREVFKISWIKPKGDHTVVFVDTETYLEVGRESKVRVSGVDYDAESWVSDYRGVQGIMFPFRQESRPKGATQSTVMEFKRVDLNPELPIAVFSNP